MLTHFFNLGPPRFPLSTQFMHLKSTAFLGCPFPPYQSRHRLLTVPVFFRDNGITTQILTYQLYVEVVVVIWFWFIIGLLPIERNLLLLRINSIIAPIVTLVIQPLFYLNGDVNFRRRILHQGLWKALKKELFNDS